MRRLRYAQKTTRLPRLLRWGTAPDAPSPQLLHRCDTSYSAHKKIHNEAQHPPSMNLEPAPPVGYTSLHSSKHQDSRPQPVAKTHPPDPMQPLDKIRSTAEYNGARHSVRQRESDSLHPQGAPCRLEATPY